MKENKNKNKSKIKVNKTKTTNEKRSSVTKTSKQKYDTFPSFGEDVFNLNTMKEYLPSKVYSRFEQCVKQKIFIDREYADIIADSMCRWAISKGVYHYSHWFHPLTGQTAEKHDSFLDFNEKKEAITKFSGKMLIQQEPDASSFPNGGIRNTFEARGYTAWDISSAAFILDSTLCIPTIFISYTGEALDYKTPLIKSEISLNKIATEVCKYFDKTVSSVDSYLGIEQEFFLVDEDLYQKRPDLALTGRTLMGHESAKNQQLEDHYLGTIPTRVSMFLQELEVACYKLAIPIKTHHNEVAPNQFEIAPLHEKSNLSIDHNLLLMALMKKIAEKHKLKVLLHEKPFKGINGSGKHNNWSLQTNTGINLFSPSTDDKENFQFLVFLVNVVKAVHRFNGLLKASVMNATNYLRLGANEAPPSIISIFLGTKLSSILDDIEKEDMHEIFNKMSSANKKSSQPFLNHLPDILIDNTDRNRTSPFAFTGNRFEFRAPGSSANCASSMIVLHSILANQLMEFKEEVDSLIEGKKSVEEALFLVVKKYIKESKNIRFDGNGYSEEWKKEAELRGLDTNNVVPTIYDCYLDEKSCNMFEKVGVLNRKELLARNEVKWEYYIKKVQIESKVISDLATNHIIPVSIRYQNLLLDNVCKFKSVYENKDKYNNLSLFSIQSIEELSNSIIELKKLLKDMNLVRKKLNDIESSKDKAVAYSQQIVPFLDSIRSHIDKMEMIVDNNIWPLPKYRELLML